MGSVWSPGVQLLLFFLVVVKLQYTGAFFQGIKKPSKIIQRMFGVEGKHINLNCYDHYEAGVKTPYVMWFFKNCGPGSNTSCEVLIKEGWNDEVICGYNQNGCNPTLHLTNLNITSNGIYSCYKYRRIEKFTIKAERLSSYILNVVEGPYQSPIFLGNGPVNKSVNVDDPAELTCTVASYLPLKFYWLKLVQIVNYDKKKDVFDNYIFEALNATTITKQSDNVYVSTLKFPYASIHDAGTYGCAASNDMETIYRQTTLEVKKCKTGFCTFPNYHQVTMSIYLILLISFCMFLNIFLLCLLRKFLVRIETKL